MTTDKRRIDACLKACKGISTQNLEDNVPVLELARRYNVVLRERDALREQQEINLSDPVVQKRLAAQWGYVPAGAQPAPSVPEGWQLVPTAESGHLGIYKMLGALHAADNTPGMSERESYRAMLSEAPEVKP